MIRFEAQLLPRYFFLLGLGILCPLQWMYVSNNTWFLQPPKPVGDGPDYENIAFHLWQGSGFVFDSAAPAWRDPYEQSLHDYAVHLQSTPRRLPSTGRPPLFPIVVAAIYSVVGRNERGFAAVRLFSATCLAVAGALAMGLTAQLLVQPGQRKLTQYNRKYDGCSSGEESDRNDRERGETVECSVARSATAGDAGGEVRGVGFAERNATVAERKAIVAERNAIVAAVGATATLLLFTVNRTLRDYATDFLTEPLALLLMQSFVVCAVRLCQTTPRQQTAAVSCTSRNVLTWLGGNHLTSAGLLAGLTWGALILTRSMFVVWLPIIWLLFVLSVPQSVSTRLKVATLVVVVAGLVCAPWWIRNCIVLQRWMPLGTQGPTTLLGGYSDAALLGNGDWQPAPELQLRHELAQRPEFQKLANDSEREVWVAEEASRRVRNWIASHRWQLPQLIMRRIYVHWNPYSGASLIWKLPLIVGAIALLLLRVREAYWLLGLPLTSTLVVAGFYSTGGRFLVPLYGLLFTLAGMGSAFVCLLVLRGWRDARPRLLGGAINERGQERPG